MKNVVPFFALLLVTVLFAACGPGQGNDSVALMLDPLPFEGERVWAEDEFDFDNIRGRVHDGLANIKAIKVDQGETYVTDFGDMTVKKFDREGKLVASYGEGQGEGPGEFSHIIDCIVADGEVWIADGRRRHISRFDVDGTYIDRFDTDFAPMRMTWHDGELYVTALAQPELIHVFDAQGNHQRAFGVLIENQVEHPMTLQGSLLSDEKGIYYAPNFASLLYRFDPDGTVRYVVETVDRQPFPGVSSEDTDRGTRFMAPDPNFVAVTASIDDRIIYVNTLLNADYFETQSDLDTRLIIDRYAAADGRYLGSLPMPVSYKRMHVYEHTLYVTEVDTAVVAVPLPR